MALFSDPSSSTESSEESILDAVQFSRLYYPAATTDNHVRLQPLSVDAKAKAVALNQQLETNSGRGIYGAPSMQLSARARNEGAILIQSQFRRLCAARAVNKVRSIHSQKNSSQIIIGSLRPQTPIYCSVDDVNNWIDHVVYVRKSLPFVCATNDVARRQLERVLNFAPGFTLRRSVCDSTFRLHLPFSLYPNIASLMRTRTCIVATFIRIHHDYQLRPSLHTPIFSAPRI